MTDGGARHSCIVVVGLREERKCCRVKGHIGVHGGKMVRSGRLVRGRGFGYLIERQVKPECTSNKHRIVHARQDNRVALQWGEDGCSPAD